MARRRRKVKKNNTDTGGTNIKSKEEEKKIKPQGQTSEGQTSKGQTNKGQTGKGQTSKGQTSKGPNQTASTKGGVAETQGQTSNCETIKGPTSKGLTSKGPTSKGPTSKGPTSKCPTSKGPTSKGPTSKGQTSKGQTSKGQTSKGQTSKGQTSKAPDQTTSTKGDVAETQPMTEQDSETQGNILIDKEDKTELTDMTSEGQKATPEGQDLMMTETADDKSSSTLLETEAGGGGDEDEDDARTIDMVDSESTTSISTIECLEEELELERSRGRRLSTPTRTKQSMTTSPSSTTSSRHSTPQQGGGSRRQSPSPTPSGSTNPAFPVRQGITWTPGGRVEAMDFIEKWYPARIVEINEEDCDVLIHFEGWNARYDEWVPMTSDRLRPLARHSERRDGKKSTPKTEYKAGECVFAKWTDCRHYAARIIAINPSGSYEVMFYDGFKKTVQPINVKYMPPEVQVEYGNAGLLPPYPKSLKKKRDSPKALADTPQGARTAKKPKESDANPAGRKRSSSLRENLAKKTPKRSDSTEKEVKSAASGTKRKKSTSGQFSKRIKMEAESSTKAAEASSPVPSTSTPKDQKVPGSAIPADPASPDLDPKPGSDLDPDPESPAAPGKSTAEESAADGDGDALKLPASVATEEAPRGEGASQPAGSGEVRHRPQEVAGSSGSEASVTMETADTGEAGVVRGSYLMAMLQGTIPLYGSSPYTDPLPPPQGKSYVASPSAGPAQVKVEEGQAAIDPAAVRGPSPATVTTVPVTALSAPKAFKVEQDHNQYKCPFDGCPKAFRKESLVEYHIKYYHTDDGKPIPPPPPRKRKKTNSVCSTDSEISVGGGRNSSSKRKKRLSEASLSSLPDTTLDRLALQIEDSMGSDLMEDTLEMDHREVIAAAGDSLALGEEAAVMKKDEEVVNCICQLNEENGLMIQCEVCLCWQHASCMELTDETLPKRYICYVCTNPPGIRDSARFIYVQDWFREGRLARFNFLPTAEGAEKNAACMLGQHDLVGDMHNVNRVLDSLRRKIHILQEKNHPEFHFWKKNWDREIEKKKQKAETAAAQSTSSVSAEPLLRTDQPNELQIKAEPIDTSQGQLVEGQNEPSVAQDLSELDPMEMGTVEISVTTSVDEETPSGSADAESSSLADNAKQNAATSSGDCAPSDGAVRPGPSLHDYSMSANPARNSAVQIVDVEGDLDDQESDPMATCEKNLLEHVMNMQDRLAQRLELIDQHVTALEEMDNMRAPHKDVLTDVPVLKKKLHHVINDLVKVKRMSRFH